MDPAGAVMAGVSVQLRGPGPSLETRSNGVGDFTFRDLPAGAYAVGLSAQGFYPKVVRVTLLAGEQKELGSIPLDVVPLGFIERDAILRLLMDDPQTSNLVVGVVGDGDQPARGLRVVMRCTVDSGCETRTAGGDGSVRFDDLKVGRYRIVVSAPGFYDEAFDVALPAGVELEFRRLLLERCAEPTCDPTKRPQGLQLE